MRVLLVAHHVPPRHVAGTEVYTARLAAALAPRHEVTVFATDDDPLLEPGSVRRRREAAWDVVELAEPRAVRRPEDSWSSPRAESTFSRLLAEARPDVCHFQHLRFLSLRLPALAKAAGVATLLTAHDYWLLCARDGQLLDQAGRRCDGPAPEKCAACLSDYRFGLSPGEAGAARFLARLRQASGIDLRGTARRLGLLARRIARKSRPQNGLSHHPAAGMLDQIEARRAAAGAVPAGIDIFIAPSQYLRGVFRDAGFGGGRWDVVGHGVDRKMPPRPSSRAGSGPLRIGFAGTVTPPKGVDILIQAVRNLPSGSYTLDVHGIDDLRPEYSGPLKREAAALPIHFHGAFDPAAGSPFMQDWDVAVVPSRWVENQPLAILESFAAGVPVVASDLGGMRELVRDGVDGRLFPVEDAAALARILSGLSADRGALEALRKGVVAPPTMADHAAKIESLYREALSLG